MLRELIALVEKNEDFLVKRVLEYAKLHGYTKYTSTLEEAWIASIAGLSKALVDSAVAHQDIPEIEADNDFVHGPITTFGVLEAQFHRQRGVMLEQYLSMMKYYRQAYLDLIAAAVEDTEKLRFYQLWVNRFFDKNEIAVCGEWNKRPHDSLLSELQMSNRVLTNEKNKFLTIYESMPTATVILDANHRCANMNYAAQQLLLEEDAAAGYFYYSLKTERPLFDAMFPWLSDEFLSFSIDEAEAKSIEKEFFSPKLGQRHLLVKFHKMLDVSEKFEGTVVLFNDMTEYKNILGQLKHLSYHDQLTGLYNRAYLREEILRLATGTLNPVTFISIDVDGLKLVNDTFGHQEGDRHLGTIGGILKNCFRENDAVVRTGGDEFVIVMPSCDEAAAERACKNIRDKVRIYNEHNKDVPVSVSVGCSSGNLLNAMSFKDILRKADIRMYAEKQANRANYEASFWNYQQSRKRARQNAVVESGNEPYINMI